MIIRQYLPSKEEEQAISVLQHSILQCEQNFTRRSGYEKSIFLPYYFNASFFYAEYVQEFICQNKPQSIHIVGIGSGIELRYINQIYITTQCYRC